MNKALALLVALAAGAQANVCNSGCDWNALAANAEAPSATCGGRITWLQNNRGLGAAAACDQVAGEFPSECGSCAGGDAPPPTPPVQPGADLEVATFNLYEWHVGANNRWGALYDKIQSQSFDIIGFQEATGVANVINSVPRMKGWSYYEPTSFGGYNDNPSPIAWDNDRFSLLASGWREVGSDQWGARGVAWVRLSDASSGSTIFFANTHGPLGSCSSTLGDNWLRVVTDNIVQGDMLIYVGDWNCGLASAALNVLTAQYTVAVDGGIDIIGFGAKIVEVAPDVVGLQECQNANALAAAAPGYTVLGGTGPQNYILYDGSRLEALESGWMDVPRDPGSNLTFHFATMARGIHVTHRLRPAGATATPSAR